MSELAARMIADGSAMDFLRRGIAGKGLNMPPAWLEYNGVKSEWRLFTLGDKTIASGVSLQEIVDELILTYGGK